MILEFGFAPFVSIWHSAGFSFSILRSGFGIILSSSSSIFFNSAACSSIMSVLEGFGVLLCQIDPKLGNNLLYAFYHAGIFLILLI
jgi:hypothetical protein